MSWSEHLVVVPVVLPLASGALMLLLDERRRTLKAAISVGLCPTLQKLLFCSLRSSCQISVAMIILDPIRSKHEKKAAFRPPRVRE